MRAIDEISVEPIRELDQADTTPSVTTRLKFYPGHGSVAAGRRPALIFLHIPKCGGNSFLDFLKFNLPVEGAFDVNFGLQYARRLRELEQLDEAERLQLQFISGHLPWGIHEWLPQGGEYVTLLRHPVDRIVSHYCFVKENPKHPLYATVTERRMTLAQYAVSGLSSELQDGQTRMLCGRASIDSLRGHDRLTRADFELARSHLLGEDMHFGLVELYPESQQLIARELGWKAPPPPTRRNVTRQRTPLAAVSRREWDMIAGANPFDMELYEVARREFVRRAAAHGINVDDSRIPSGPAPLLQRVKTRWQTTLKQQRRHSARSVARAALERCGLDVRLRRNVERARAEEKQRNERDRWKAMTRYQPRTILDIGANTGQFVAIARHFCPQASIISFEPLASCQDALLRMSRQDARHRALPFALGRRSGQAEIHRSAFSPSSSLLPMGDLHRREFPHTAETTAETIDIRRLDDLADDLSLTTPIVAKIDVQGSELDVFEGGATTFRRCAALIVELSYFPLYEEQPLFDAVYERLKSLGFVYRGSLDQLVSPRDGRILQSDGLFENAELVTGNTHLAMGANVS